MDWSTMLYDAVLLLPVHTTTIFASDRDIFVLVADELHPIKLGTVLNPGTGAPWNQVLSLNQIGIGPRTQMRGSPSLAAGRSNR
jgi:hypothetical protein